MCNQKQSVTTHNQQNPYHNLTKALNTHIQASYSHISSKPHNSRNLRQEIWNILRKNQKPVLKKTLIVQDTRFLRLKWVMNKSPKTPETKFRKICLSVFCDWNVHPLCICVLFFYCCCQYINFSFIKLYNLRFLRNILRKISEAVTGKYNPLVISLKTKSRFWLLEKIIGLL